MIVPPAGPHRSIRWPTVCDTVCAVLVAPSVTREPPGPAVTAVKSPLPQSPQLSGASAWMHNRQVDTMVAWLWVPFSVAAAVAYPSGGALAAVVGLTLLISLVHQPLTLGLIYGDPAQFAVAKRVFTIFPFVLMGAVIAGRMISLSLVAVIAGLWNAEHTLMQRYGITRIYGRKAGEGTKAAERPMLISWLVFVLAFAAADARTPKLLNKVDLGATNEEGIRILQSLRPWAVGGACIAAIAVVGYTLRWWRAERERGVRGLTPKRRYLLATAVLFVVMLINPIVGLIGYVGAHAVEYFVIVHGALGRRYVGPVAESGGIVGRAVRSPLRATGCVIAYVIIVGVALVTVQFRLEADLANVILLTVGGMHVFFDGFIWKLRRPVVARSVAAA